MSILSPPVSFSTGKNGIDGIQAQALLEAILTAPMGPGAA
jgi:hypothetical protein